MKFIPYAKQYIDQNDIDAVVNVLKSDFLTTGPEISSFEKELCEVTGSKYAVVMSNGTAALHAACFVAGINIDDEVITSPITFAASANCVLYCGGKPVFADILPDTYSIDPISVKNHISEKTKAIIPVYYTGQIVAIDELISIAKKFNLLIIADGAHAIGATYKNTKSGQLVDMTTLSFHAVKQVAAGEGGAVLTNDESLYRKLILFRSHGITRGLNCIQRDIGGWYYEQQLLGYNYRMSDIQAALGRSQLKKLLSFLNRRKEIVHAYNDAFSNIDGVIVPPYDPESAWHLYVLQLDIDKIKKTRRQVYDDLHTKGIGVNVHYIPVYYHPYYKSLGYKKGLCPRSERLYERIISLPLYVGLTDEDVKRVISSVISCIE